MALVTVAAFRDPHTAHIARSLLETEGIPAFVDYEHHVGMNWMYSRALGGVRLRVPEADAERAKELLGAADAGALAFEPDDGPPPDDSERCPDCGSLEIEVLPLERRTKAISMLVALPFAWRRGYWRCRACGHAWRPPRPYRSLPAILGYAVALVFYLLWGIARLLLVILTGAKRLAVFGQRIHHCWRCGASYTQGRTVCPGCGIALPSPRAYERHVEPGAAYDAACPRCHLPYRASDYDRDRTARCSWCKGELAI